MLKLKTTLMKLKKNSMLSSALLVLSLTTMSQAETLSFDGNIATDVENHVINATSWADYVGGQSTFNSSNAWGRLYWRDTAGDGQYINFDLSSLAGKTVVGPALVTLQNGNATWGGGVTGSYVATANGSWTAAAGQSLPGATQITNAVNPTGSYGNGAAVSWGIGSTTFQGLVNNPSSYYGLAVIGGPGSQLHFTGPTNPLLSVATGNLTAATGLITANTGASTWNASNYTFQNSSIYTPTLNTLNINGALVEGISGAGTVVINNGGTIAVNQAGNVNYYEAVDGTSIYTGGRLTINAHSNISNLTLAGGELASTGTDATWGSWGITTETNVTGGVTSTISAQQVTLSNGVFNVDSGSSLNFTGSTRAGSLIKNGAGTMRFTGWQSYTGGTTINAGTLEVANQNSGNGWLRGAVTVNQGGTLQFTGGDGTGFGWNSNVTNLTINGGSFLGGGHVGFGNYMTVALNDGGLISGAGQWNGDGRLGFSSSGNSTNTISGNWTLRTDNGAIHSFNVGDGTSNVDLLINANLTDQNVAWLSAASLNKVGLGTMVLSGTNSYRGGTSVNSGTLVFANTAARAGEGTTSVAAGATLGLGVGGSGFFSSVDVASLFSNTMSRVSIDANAVIGIDTSAGNFVLSDSITDSPSRGLTKLGQNSLEITGANTYTGATVVRQGSLVVNGSIANATPTTVQSGATISGSGSVGNLTVDSGAFVNPGNSPGILTVNGAYNQAGTLVTEITGLNAGTQHDQVVVNGAVSLTGSLNVQFTGGTYSVDNLIFLLLNDSTDAVNGIFTGFNEGSTVAQYGGFDWIISYNANSSTSSFTGGNDIALRAIPEPSAAILGGLGLLGCLRRRRK